MAAAIVRLDLEEDNAGGWHCARDWIGWANEAVITGDGGTSPVRLSLAALATVRTEVRRGARLRSPDIETGGMLLGQIDKSAGVVLIDVATPPTPLGFKSLMSTRRPCPDHASVAVRGRDPLDSRCLAFGYTLGYTLGYTGTQPALLVRGAVGR